MSDWDKLADEIHDLLKAEVKDLWKEEDKEFLRQLAVDVAREKVLASTAAAPAQHEANLRHLAATIQGEIARREIELNKKGAQLFGRILESVIRTVAVTALKAVVG